MSMEQIIRPFQIGDVFTARPHAPARPATVEVQEQTVLVIGKPNPSSYTQYVLSGIGQFKVEWSEESRVTSRHRITQPGKPENYVDVERIDALTLKSNDGQRIDFRLNG
jgi:hypothetical protein